MKSKIYCSTVIALLILGIGSLNAQESDQKIMISTGFGYYDPVSYGPTGNIFYSKISYRLPTDIFLGVGFATSTIFSEHQNSVFFNGERTYEQYYLYSINFEKPIDLRHNRKHKLLLTTGIVYEEVKFSRVDIIRQLGNDGEPELQFVYNRSNSNANNLGTILELNYYYRIIDGLDIGIQFKTHLLIDIGLAGIIIAPNLSISL